MAGQNRYLPKNVLEEIEKIKKDKNLKGQGSDTIALNDMVDYSRVGRELEKVMNRASGGLLPIPKSKKKRGWI